MRTDSVDLACRLDPHFIPLKLQHVHNSPLTHHTLSDLFAVYHVGFPEVREIYSGIPDSFGKVGLSIFNKEIRNSG
jgi:hypothetical protein